MAAPCPLLGDGITDDTLLHIACFLPTARDLLSLLLTCPRFAAKGRVIAAPIDNSDGGAVSGCSARYADVVDRGGGSTAVVGAVHGEQERGWAPRRELESRLALMREVELLRVPLAFGRATPLLSRV